MPDFGFFLTSYAVSAFLLVFEAQINISLKIRNNSEYYLHFREVVQVLYDLVIKLKNIIKI